MLCPPSHSRAPNDPDAVHVAPTCTKSSGVRRRAPLRINLSVFAGEMPRLFLRLPKASLQAYITSFLGFMDIKVGSQILTLFSLFNKIAGIYGIIAIFQGGTIAQLSLYIYSIATIPIFIWGLKSISDVRTVFSPCRSRQAPCSAMRTFSSWTK